MFHCIKNQTTRSVGTLFLRFVVAALLVGSLQGFSVAQTPLLPDTSQEIEKFVKEKVEELVAEFNANLGDEEKLKDLIRQKLAESATEIADLAGEVQGAGDEEQIKEAFKKLAKKKIRELDLASDFEKIKGLVGSFEEEFKQAVQNSKFLRKVRRFGIDQLIEATGGKAEPKLKEKITLWDVNSDLNAKPLERVGFTADSSAAYGLLGFQGAKYDEFGRVCKDGGGKPLTIKLTGKFPDAQYMSLQVYRGRPFQSSKGVGKLLTDYEISPKRYEGIPDDQQGKNRFQTGNRNDEGEFEIYIRPVDDVEAADAAAEKRVDEGGTRENTIYYKVQDYEAEENGDSTVISAFYRVYLPKDQVLNESDLPKIEGFLTEPDGDGKYSHENPSDTDKMVQVHPEFAKLVKSWFVDIPVGNIISNVGRLWEREDPLAFFNVNKVFKVIEKFVGAGASADLRYEMCFKQVAVGEYAVIRFKAPKLYFGKGPEDEANVKQGKAVRYWSICPVYLLRMDALNSVSCDPNRPDARDVTVVFGKDRPAARALAAKIGAEFLPDTRKESHRVMTFLMRNMLPTNREVLAFPERAEKKKEHEEAVNKLREVAEVFEEVGPKIGQLEKDLKYFEEKRWMFHGEYKPKGAVFSLRELIRLNNECLDKLFDADEFKDEEEIDDSDDSSGSYLMKRKCAVGE